MPLGRFDREWSLPDGNGRKDSQILRANDTDAVAFAVGDEEQRLIG